MKALLLKQQFFIKIVLSNYLSIRLREFALTVCGVNRILENLSRA